MEKKWDIIEILKYCRHDWLNKVQLIKGNLELGKVDEVKGIIEAFIMESKNEAQLSNLHMPKMAELLITLNWRGLPFAFEYEILEAKRGCPLIDQKMYDWTLSFIGCLCQSLDPVVANELKAVIYEKDESIRFTFDLRGKIMNKDLIAPFLRECPTAATICINECTTEELVFDIEWKCE
ncbi:Spo0B domain-containing protein [Bacillus sp. AGMB 02131]|uniref:Spo0B domain-containing protein n=1 Tax=Peribacillus faecalis TaxID=2772559 RepID=A0A927CUK3_9BACI|nr:Spo0B domain-containing protein [Peribacillus faecalis]MBD3107848.1 Spo0B domain-containing protein [Peribacillus faecalis]